MNLPFRSFQPRPCPQAPSLRRRPAIGSPPTKVAHRPPTTAEVPSHPIRLEAAAQYSSDTLPTPAGVLMGPSVSGSTACRDSTRFSWRLFIAEIWEDESFGSCLIQDGLSETSASLKEGRRDLGCHRSRGRRAGPGWTDRGGRSAP